MQALLIIDMQVGPLASNQRHEADKVIARINRLSAHFRSIGAKVIFIQHNGFKERYLFPGTPDFQIVPQLVRERTDACIVKEANDSFYATELHAFLQKNQVSDLYITGCATDFCVNATVHGALVRDYNIVVVSDGHTTADRPGFNAPDLIAFHNWLWANLTPTGGSIAVRPVAEIIGA